MSEIKKHFLSYDEQIDLLKQKKLSIKNDEIAKSELKRYSYYSLITGYKDIFKIAKNGDYKSDASFEGIIYLYKFDDYMREIRYIHILSVNYTAINKMIILTQITIIIQSIKPT